jgi:phosphatidylglycerophosphate synthase
MSELSTEIDSLQINPLRELIESPLDVTARYIHENYPLLTANVVTVAGGLAMAAMDVGMVLVPNHAKKFAVAHSIIRIKDLIDGRLADLEAEDNGGYRSNVGAFLDTFFDRANDYIEGGTLAIRAVQEGDYRIGPLIHTGSGVTSSWPSLGRARAEANAVGVPEGGGGTAAARAGYGVLAHLLTDHPKATRAISAFSAAQNIRTARHRLQATAENSEYASGSVSDKKIKLAKIRYPMLGTISILEGAIALKFLSKLEKE